MPLIEYTPNLPDAGTLAGTEPLAVIDPDTGLPVQTTTQDIADLAPAPAAGSLARTQFAAGNAGRWNDTALTDTTYTMVDADVVLDGSGLGAATDVALPSAASSPGRLLWVKCSGTQDITLTPAAGTIGGSAAVTLASGSVVAVYVAVGTDWKNILSL